MTIRQSVNKSWVGVLRCTSVAAVPPKLSPAKTKGFRQVVSINTPTSEISVSHKPKRQTKKS